MKRSDHPSPILEYWLVRVLPPNERESLLGDFQEIYRDVVNSYGQAYATGWYLFHVLRLVPSFCADTLERNLTMLKNYLHIASRILWKHRGFTFINVMGLAIGLSASLLILQYVSQELSYDTFHEDGDQIYRVRYDRYNEGSLVFKSATTFPDVGPGMVEVFPEVEAAARLLPRYGVV